MTKLLVLVGTGPGIGLSTATLFASKGFDVALLSRNAARLEEDAQKVGAAGQGKVKVMSFPVDVSDHVGLKKTLGEVEQHMGKPEVVVFNAARIAQTVIGETSEEDLIGDFKVSQRSRARPTLTKAKLMNIGQYVAASWALPLLEDVAEEPDTHPSFFLTSSGVSYDPIPFMLSLSMMKAAQNNFLASLAKVAGPEGVHVGRIDINGVVSDEEEVRNAKHIAEQLWELYQQDKDNWSFVEDCGDMDGLLKAVGVESKRVLPA
ncbi:short-chain alcohol dehydrogenase [Cladophialophora carrionii]|uniref:Short-chain alcohol dehydrogenase n=1 Tax=Cladophialophora carrionii TaxID=86049 RepID=A0A1C1CKN5_9EURO|nr:short-chain alcohol dehydrogenase [Cladophialophora carrionii]